ncbi:MFS transporter [Ningiella sp. W23]|uniref:MFS transporter n=1 Tax=Ningiella sp. W23 TaxID=3023715 RepID=UPI0037563320
MQKHTSYPIFLAFLCMGFGDVVGPLTSQLQNDYQLSNLAAGLVTFMGFIMFGLLSVPMSIYQARTSKKHVLQLGLLAALLGMIIPMVSGFNSFALVLTGLLLLGTGATLLQVAGNPIMRDISTEGRYSSNLSFGQFIKAIGSLSGALIPILAAKMFGLDWKILFPIYSAFILLVVVYLYFTHIEEQAPPADEKPASFSSCLSLLKDSRVAPMVFGIFLYVGAEVSMSSKLPNYLQTAFDFDIKQTGLFGTLFFFFSLMVGRFLGGFILRTMAPQRFLQISILASLAGTLGLFAAPNYTLGFACIGLIGLGFANVFPLIFSITIDRMPHKSNEISGLMVTAIIGGAIVPVLFGWVADTFGLLSGFVVTIISFVYLFMIAIKREKKEAV